MPTQPKKLSCEDHGVSKGRSGLDERAQKTVEHLERQESASSLSNQKQETKGCQKGLEARAQPPTTVSRVPGRENASGLLLASGSSQAASCIGGQMNKQ